MPGEYIEKQGGTIAQLSREEFLGLWLESWDKRGRGWEVFEYPVGLEPPFMPLSRILNIPEEPVSDDGRIPSFFSSFFRASDSPQALAETNLARFRSALAEYSYRLIDEHAPEFCGYEDERFTEFQLVLPKESPAASRLSVEFILSLSYLKHPVSFEVIGSESQVVIQFAATQSDAEHLSQQLKAHQPEISLRETSGFLGERWVHSDVCDREVHFGLSNNFVLSLKESRLTDFDYLVPVVAGMSDLVQDEIAVIQILFTRARGQWNDEALQAIEYLGSLSPFEESKDRAAAAKKKLTQPLFATAIRIGAKAATEDEALSIIRRVASGLAAFSNPSSNEFIPLEETGNPEVYEEQALITRTSYRSGMLLSSTELASLVHLPTDKVMSEKLIRESGVTKLAPEILIGNDLVLGTNLHEGKQTAVSLSDTQRSRHVHLIGASGSGKTNLILNMALQDIEKGKGLCVLDPHGDLIDDILKRIPESKSKNVILFDPSDAEFPIGFNVLAANSELEKTLLSSDLIATFRRLSTSWGDVMDAVLANAILAIIESDRGGTLLDLKRFLVEEGFRRKYLETTPNESVKYFWEREFPLIGGKPQSSILIRLDTFLRQRLIRNIVCQREMKLDFRKIMDSGQCLLIKLSQGAIGEENSHLLGSLLISKLHQIALSRQDSDMRPFFSIYIDEFQNFITPSMEKILSGVRKYNIGLVLSHQEFRQLQSRDQDVASSVLSNCYSRICFRLAEADAERLSKGLSFFDSMSLQNLGIGEAIVRVEKSEFDFNLSTDLVPDVGEVRGSNNRGRIAENSRLKFASDKASIDSGFFSFSSERAQPNPEKNPAKEEGSVSSASIKTPRVRSSDIETNRTARRRQSTARGSDVHRDIQNAILRMAETNGFSAEVEKPILDGRSRIDVSLQNGRMSIACQVSVTTDAAHEIRNAKKCLTAGYDLVAVVSSNRDKLPSIAKRAEMELSSDDRKKVRIVSITEFLELVRRESSVQPSHQARRLRINNRLNIEEASEVLGVSVSTVYRWVRAGKIPYYRIGRNYQFERRELALVGRTENALGKSRVDLPPIDFSGRSTKSKSSQTKRYRDLMRRKKERK